MLTFTDYREYAGTTPNGLVKQALAHMPKRRWGEALDLGAGNLRDSTFLLSQGFESVTAVDWMPMPEPPEGVVTRREKLQDYVPLPNTYDFACCVNVLFFLKPDETARTIARTYNGLKDGGIFVLNLLGDLDEWVVHRKSGTYGYSFKEIEALFSGLDVIASRHARFKGRTALGSSKDWDIWERIIRK